MGLQSINKRTDRKVCGSAANNQWAEAWLSSVASGSAKMSQRTLASIQKQGGSLAVVKALARSKKVHLLLVKDDKGTELVAASLEPFKVIC